MTETLNIKARPKRKNLAKRMTPNCVSVVPVGACGHLDTLASSFSSHGFAVNLIVFFIVNK